MGDLIDLLDLLLVPEDYCAQQGSEDCLVDPVLYYKEHSLERCDAPNLLLSELVIDGKCVFGRSEHLTADDIKFISLILSGSSAQKILDTIAKNLAKYSVAELGNNILNNEILKRRINGIINRLSTEIIAESSKNAIDDDLLSWYKSALQETKDIPFKYDIAKIIFKQVALPVQDDIQLAKREELFSFILEYIKAQPNFCKHPSNPKVDLLSVIKDIPTEHILIYEKFIDFRDWLQSNGCPEVYQLDNFLFKKIPTAQQKIISENFSKDPKAVRIIDQIVEWSESLDQEVCNNIFAGASKLIENQQDVMRGVYLISLLERGCIIAELPQIKNKIEEIRHLNSSSDQLKKLI